VFVHYLMFGAHDGSRNAIANYFEVLGAGNHPDAAFQEAFGHDYATMARTLGTYIRTGRYEMRIRPESAAAKITAATVPAPAPAVQVALARLALAAERFDVARPHAERAVALAPEEPGGYEMLAQVLDRMGDKSGALAACVRAEKSGSQDASTLFLLAYLSANGDLSPAGEGPSEREIAHLYRRVIAACPTMEEAYQNLAGIGPALESVEDADIDLLMQGARMFPRRGEIVLGLAALEDNRGNRANARALLAEARKRGLPLDAERNATRMEEGWIYDEATARIETLLRADHFEEALAVCDDAIAQVGDIYGHSALMRVRQNITTHARMDEADDALRAGDFATARRLYEALLADPAVPGNLRRPIEDVLRRLPIALPASTNAVTP
jgi:tetratricopeptide (TPR) repeat protein